VTEGLIRRLVTPVGTVLGAFREQARWSAWLLAGTVATALLSYASVILSARLLGAAEFGLLGAFLGIVALATIGLRPLYTVATHMATTELAGDTPEPVRGFAGPILILSTLVGMVSLGIAALGAEQLKIFFQTADVRPFLLLAPLLAGVACVQMATGLLSGLQRFSLLAAVSVLEAFLRAILTAPLALALGVSGSLVCYAAGLWVAAVISLRLVRATGWRVPPAQQLMAPARTGASSLVLGLVVGVLQSTDLVLLRSYAPAEAVGAYAAAASMGNVLFTVAAPLYVPAFPRTLAAYRNRQPSWPILAATLGPVAMGGLLAVAGAAWLGEPLVGILFGSPFSSTATVLPGYIAKTTALVALTILGQHAMAVGRAGLLSLATPLALVGPALIAHFRPSAADVPILISFVTLVTIGVLSAGLLLGSTRRRHRSESAIRS
jgi:O-antigen/teichoic acid export membrane protein